MILLYSIEWYIFIQLLGILSFLITFKLFHKLPDHGYCVSKALGIIFSGFISWIIMTYNFCGYTFSSAVSYVGVLILFILAALSVFKVLNKEELKVLYNFVDKRYRFIIFVELSFLVILIAGAYMRAFSPDILSIHKLQDFVYIKSLMQTTSLPPDNLWLSGYKINYYYLGYFIIANLMNIIPISIDLSFNLIPGTILGLIAIISGGIVYNLSNNKFYGILGGLLTAMLSNYHGFYQIMQSGLKVGFDWWSSAHTLGNGSFTEFPFWSFTLGDIQGFFICHVLILSLIYVVIASIKEDIFILWPKLTFDKILSAIIIVIITAMIIPTNLFAIFSCILVLTILPILSIKLSIDKRRKIIFYFLTLITIVIVAGLIDSQFFMNYQFPAKNISFLNSTSITSFTNFFIIFGVFILPILFLMLSRIVNILNLSISSTILSVIGVCSIIEILLLSIFKVNSVIINIIVILLLLAITYFSFSKVFKSNNNSVFIVNISFLALITAILIILYLIIKSSVLIIMIILALFSLYNLFKETTSDKFIVYGLLLAVSVLIACSEIFYFVIISNDNMITISYLYIQAQLIFPLILTMVIYYTKESLAGITKEIYITVVALILIPCFLFTILGPLYKSNMFKPQEGLIPNLSGTNHLILFHECDNQAIEWMKDALTPGTIILEATKPGEILNGRISGYSGMSTVIANKDEINFTYGSSLMPVIQERLNDVNAIYSEPDKKRILSLIKKYNIKYIYVGELEQALYKPSSLEGFVNIAVITNTAARCKIYKMF